MKDTLALLLDSIFNKVEAAESIALAAGYADDSQVVIRIRAVGVEVDNIARSIQAEVTT